MSSPGKPSFGGLFSTVSAARGSPGPSHGAHARPLLGSRLRSGSRSHSGPRPAVPAFRGRQRHLVARGPALCPPPPLRPTPPARQGALPWPGPGVSPDLTPADCRLPRKSPSRPPARRGPAAVGCGGGGPCLSQPPVPVGLPCPSQGVPSLKKPSAPVRTHPTRPRFTVPLLPGPARDTTPIRPWRLGPGCLVPWYIPGARHPPWSGLSSGSRTQPAQSPPPPPPQPEAIRLHSATEPGRPWKPSKATSGLSLKLP